jgi:dihydroorotate dehydrogenase (fumarate)
MDLTTHYLGLKLKNPLIASSAPPNANLDHLRRLEDAGAAAIVLPSLFEEQIEAMDSRFNAIVAAATGNNPEAQQHYLPPTQIASGPYGLVPERYLELVRRARASLSIPVIASLNGAAAGNWLDYGRKIEQAGAHALEVNLYRTPTDLDEAGEAIEAAYLAVVRELRGQLSIPLSVKMSPYFTNVGNMARRFVEAGADGVVIFNRYLQPDIDLNRLTLASSRTLSQPADMRLPLQWVALLAGQVRASLAASTGVGNAQQALGYLYAGADAVMLASAVLRDGPPCLSRLLNELNNWLDARGVASLDVVRGAMSFARLKNRNAWVRSHYLEPFQG